MPPEGIEPSLPGLRYLGPASTGGGNRRLRDTSDRTGRADTCVCQTAYLARYDLRIVLAPCLGAEEAARLAGRPS